MCSAPEGTDTHLNAVHHLEKYHLNAVHHLEKYSPRRMRQHGMQQLVRGPQKTKTTINNQTNPTETPSCLDWTSTDSLGRSSMPSVEVPRLVLYVWLFYCVAYL
jgi:hypothetical protein